MPEYFTLFNAVTDAIAQLEKAVAALKQAQIDAEEAYIQRGEMSFVIMLYIVVLLSVCCYASLCSRMHTMPEPPAAPCWDPLYPMHPPPPPPVFASPAVG